MTLNGASTVIPLLALLVLSGHLPEGHSLRLPTDPVVRRSRTLQDLYRYVQQQYLMCLKCPNCPCETRFNLKRRSEDIAWPQNSREESLNAKNLEDALDDFHKREYE